MYYYYYFVYMRGKKTYVCGIRCFGFLVYIGGGAYTTRTAMMRRRGGVIWKHSNSSWWRTNARQAAAAVDRSAPYTVENAFNFIQEVYNTIIRIYSSAACRSSLPWILTRAHRVVDKLVRWCKAICIYIGYVTSFLNLIRCYI